MSTSVHLKEKLIHYDSYVDQKALNQYCNFYAPPPKGYCTKGGAKFVISVNVYNVLKLYLCLYCLSFLEKNEPSLSKTFSLFGIRVAYLTVTPSKSDSDSDELKLRYYK